MLQLDGDSKPNMGSLTLSSVNFDKVASLNSPDMIQSLAREIKRRGILAELTDRALMTYKYMTANAVSDRKKECL